MNIISISSYVPRLIPLTKGVYSYYQLYNLFEAAIANLLCLETLRHGTNIVNQIKMYYQGADPSKGGEASVHYGLNANNTEPNTYEDLRRNFYVFKDTEAKIDPNNQSKLFGIAAAIHIRINTILHSTLSGFNLPIIGPIIELCSPTLKIHMDLK